MESATVIFAEPFGKYWSSGIRIQWYGGPPCIYAFLEELERRGAVSDDPARMASRFIQVVGDYLDYSGHDGDGLWLMGKPKSLNPESLMCWTERPYGVYVVAPIPGAFDDSSCDAPWFVRRITGKNDWRMSRVDKERVAAMRHECTRTFPVVFRYLDEHGLVVTKSKQEKLDQLIEAASGVGHAA